ncbi:MAG: DarT ssDNA thymidine ADP-ribosyltransferase family protein [Gemmatimonadaceae bacterium]
MNWSAIASTDFRSADVKEGKQAEFLVRDSFPWTLVSRVGVRSMQIAERVEAILTGSGHRPRVEVRPEWYY